jgi:PAS domain S-box-containing protein
MTTPDRLQPDALSPALAPEPERFLAGDGEMATIMRGHDWATTPLGPPARWPQTLRTVVRLMLNSRFPMFIFWGPDGACLYNDAYRASIGSERHPAALGRPAQEIWTEIWDVIGPQIEFVMSGGGATWHESQLIPITRHGRREDVWWTYGYSPIDDATAASGVGGVLVITHETTAQVLAQRRQAEGASARAAERDRLARLFEQAPSFMALLSGPEHRFDLANQAYMRLVDHRPVLGRTVAEALPEAVAQGYVGLLDAAFASGLPYSAKGARFVRDGAPGGASEERFVDFIFQPIRSDTGDVAGIFVEGLDTTDRTVAENEVRRASALLRAIIETAPGLIYAKDVAGRMLIANSAALNLIGKPWSEVAGRTDAEFLDNPAQGEAVMANDRRVIAAGRAEELEEMVSRPGEPPSLFLSTKTPLRDEAGEIVGLVGVSVDITDRKRAERELQRLNATLEARVQERTAERDRTWRNAQDLLCIVDADGYLRAANPAWTATLGWRPEEVVGRHHLSFNPPEDWPEHEAAHARATTTGLPIHDSRMLHRDGSIRWVAWVATNEGGMVYASGRDVTAQKQAAEALARTEELLRQSQKMEAVGQLTGGIAHDFNNMLQGVTSGIALARRRIATGQVEAAGEFLDLAVAAADRAAALTRRLLAFGRRQPLDARAVSPDALVRGMEGLLQRTVGPAITVETRLQDGCWPVRCDPNQLESALLNLAINARDAMAQGGRLVVETAHVVLGAAETNGWDGAAPGDYVRISVIDDGAGMTPDVLAHAFEPFFTTKPDGQGTGLGLSQIFGFVRQSNGVVLLDSAVGAGTSAHLYLPRMEATDIVAERPASQARTRNPGGEAGVATVLMVEDETSIRSFAAQALREAGLVVIEAADGPSGLNALRAALGAYETTGVDLLVTDVGLPGGLNGRQLADAARELLPDLPVLLITGYAGLSIEGTNRLAPGMEMLTKPFELDALTERVGAMISAARRAAG